MSASPLPVRTWLSFRRIVDIPFGTCVAALESWQLTGWQPTGHDSGRRTGRSLVCGPIEHDRDSGTCRIQVRLARGPLRPALHMRLQADYWSSSPPRTAVELIPCGHVRPSAAYFRVGHRLLDSLTRSLAQQQHTRPQEHDMALFMDFHEDLTLPAEAIGPARYARPCRRHPATAFEDLQHPPR
ncbi:MAG TPA: hypothetical protein VKV35_00545 [Streptosporangiaceae bacterium]|jgi:hypothetical protein|nr:hypothetical protein [Streptosporangiaceae bacterium]